MESQQNATAQQLIDDVQQENKTKEEFKKLFYKEMWLQDVTDSNITRCLKELKNKEVLK